MKIWCESCEGTGTVTNALCLGSGIRGIGAVQSERCNKCEGEGYTEHEGNLEDLELAQAVKLIFEQRNIIAIEPSYDFMMNLDGSEDYISDAKELINWYREQKESEHNE